ncbi:NADAR family protein [Alienimonas californiensis]|uniref:Swarming motility protein YbiA n=1 Tax=Alienimonas californiensis TaxID=2527989 RepID=A0A517P6W5_9PLAN|nr:NADAR family protein [Alienimonas californiensis]QDT15119.1 Swarming motility protein YbiA [Alienimonas californiensis]
MPDDAPDPLAARTAAALCEAVAAGATPKYLCFWGHTAPAGAAVGSTCLSQWFPAAFTVDGVSYPTAEHWMMAEKARLFGDDAAVDRVLAATHPGAAKRVGREVRGYDDAAWAAARFDVVVRGNAAKFAQHAELATFLRTTAARVLVEASPRDRIWGIGLTADDDRAADPFLWRGENLLGFALMEVRDGLAAD